MNLHGAPHVANPLQFDKFVKSPCALLTAQQMKTLAKKYKLGTKGMPTKTHTDIGSCDYEAKDFDPNAAYGSTAFLKGGGGLSVQYEQRDTFTVWEPMTISGYPAVHNVAKEEKDNCLISVGISDHQVLAVEFDGTENKSTKFTCEAAKAMATDAVETIKSQQGK